VTPDDLLIVQVRNALAGVSLGVGLRTWHPRTGIVEHNIPITPTSDRSLNTFSLALDYGYLVSAAAKVTAGSPRRGQTLVTMLLARPPVSAFAPKMILAQDYLTSSYGPLWPGGRHSLGVEGPGMLYSFIVAIPASGADWVQAVPTGARWLLHGIYATLITVAGGGARTPLLVFDDGANRVAAAVSGVGQAGALTNDWTWAPGTPTTGLLSGVVNNVALPFPVPLFAGWRVRPITANITLGDQWAPIRLLVEEWLED